ncbi:MAG TPA: hypothetical protein VK002_16030 [Rubricoccaceae bacterium]|nr:hypothetical protein [Rubricoccaceae bacterium]
MSKSKVPIAGALLALLPLALLTAALAACDTGGEDPDPTAVTFDGVPYVALGGARLETTAAGLVVRRGDGAGEYGVRVDLDAALDGPLAEADFRAAPVDLPAGGRWGLQLFGDVAGLDDGGRTPVATVWSDAVNDTTHVINFDFGPEAGVETVTVEYYLQGRLLYRVPEVPLTPDGGRTLLTTVGEGEGAPQSVHLIRDGTRYIVATDYGGEGPRTGPGGCAGTVLRVSLPNFPDIPPSFCTDYVRAIPEQFGNVEAATHIEIRARTLDRFTLVSNDLE